MATLKTRYHSHNGTEFDVHHHETQASQVKIIEGGVIKSSVEEMLVNGKAVTGVDIATLTSTGIYLLSGCTGMPFTATASTYIMEVTTSGTLTHQTVIDHINGDNHFRTLINKVKNNNWDYAGRKVQGDIVLVKGNIGTLASLQTASKSTIVSAINEVLTKTDAVTARVGIAEDGITLLGQQMSAHNHDGRYLRSSGGDLTGSASVPNQSSFQGKNTSGTKLNLGKVDSSNNVVLGDVVANSAVIHAKGGNLNVHDGTKSNKVFHAGNMGAGSKLDADTVDGLQGSVLARRDTVNDFEASQGILNGGHLTLKAPAGSGQSGGVYFRGSDGTLKGSITTNPEGDLKFTSGTFSRHEINANGEFISGQSHIIDSGVRDAMLTLRKGSSDRGVGINIDSSNEFAVKDFSNGVTLMKANRSTGIVSFGRHITIQGRRLYIQASAPAVADVGDVWIDI